MAPKKTLGTLFATLALISFPAGWADSVAIQSLHFDNNTLVITSPSATGRPRLESWESHSGNADTRMMVLDLPDATGDKQQLAAGIQKILTEHPQIKRLIVAPLNSGTLRVVLEVAHPPGETLLPALSQKDGEVRLSLSAGGTPTGSPASAAASNVISKTADSNNDAGRLLKDQVTTLTAELNAGKSQITTLQKQNEALRHDLDSAQAQNKTQPADNTAELAAVKSQIAMLQKQNEALRHDLDNALAQAKAQPADSGESGKLKDQITVLNSQLDAGKSQITALQKQNDALRHDLDNALAQAQKQNSAADSSSKSGDAGAKAELDRARKLRDELVLANQDLVKKNKGLSDDYKNATNHLQASLEENVRLQQALEEATKEEATKKPPATADKKSQQAVTAGNESLNSVEDPAVLQSALQQTVQERNDARQQVAALQKKVDELNGRLVDQNSTIRELVPGNPSQVENLKAALIATAKKLEAAQQEIDRLTGSPEKHLPVHHNSNDVESGQKPQSDEPATTPKAIYSPDPPLRSMSQAQLETVIRQHPDRYDAYMQLESIYVGQRNYTNAEATLQNLLVVNPRYADAYYALADVFMLQNSPIRARASLETYKRLRPDDTMRITDMTRRIDAASANQASQN